MCCPEIHGVLARIPLRQLQVVDSLQSSRLLFHTPPQIRLIEDLDLSLLQSNDVFCLFHEKALLEDITKQFKIYREIAPGGFLANDLHLVLTSERQGEILAKLQEVGLGYSFGVLR